jgi:hypothetical protein
MFINSTELFDIDPTRILLTSPRMTAPYHTEVLSPILTSPMTEALGAIKESTATTGRLLYKFFNS